MKYQDAYDYSNKIKQNRQTIVFTNGCFDILHPGHIDYLTKASKLGDYFIIGLNSDNSVKRLKGDKRPVMNQKSRQIMLESIKGVNKVFLFEEDTPYEIIKSIVPDIIVKGGDYSKEDVVGGDIVEKNGGKVEIIPFLEGYSTTSIIERIKNIYEA